MFLDEGRATMGVWLPLAMADVFAAAVAVLRVNAAKPEEIKVPKRSEVLASWCLPMMAKSFEAAEKEQEAFALLESVKRLKRRFEK